MSTPIKNGGSAFPLYLPQDEGNIRDGMTLRDWFAGQALAGKCGYSAEDAILAKKLASESYLIADAMIAAREVKP